MSAENLEIVRRWVAAWHGVDQVPVFESFNFTPAMKDFAARFPHPDFEMEIEGDLGKLGSHGGEGFFEGWREYVLAWASLRHEYKEPIDCGDRVLVPTTQRARTKLGDVEIVARSAAVFTFRAREAQEVRSVFARTRCPRSAGPL